MEIGYSTYSEGVPAGMSYRQEKMVKTCKQLQVNISVLESELYDFNDMVKYFSFFDSGLKERVNENYTMKIKHRLEEYDDIKENLKHQGIRVEDSWN